MINIYVYEYIEIAFWRILTVEQPQRQHNHYWKNCDDEEKSIKYS